jgi:hypothetical protein
VSASTYQSAPTSIVVFDSFKNTNTWMSQARLDVQLLHQLGPVKLQWMAALDYSGVPQVNFISSASGVSGRWPMGNFAGFALLRFEPEMNTSQLNEFFHGPSGLRSVWNDNGDGIPQANEAGAALNSTGSRYHLKEAHLKRPFAQQFVLGFTTPQFGAFQFTFSTIGRFLFDRYTVCYGNAPQFQTQQFQDPSTGGRGEEPASDGHQYFDAQARQPGGEGQETYVLTNSKQVDFFLGLELQLLSITNTWWFVNLTGDAYLSVGGAPFGNGADKNDPGIIDESTADPNNRINERGRYNHDRSFGLNIMAGVKPVQGLSLSGILHYRDGEPFTRIVIDSALPQGPQALMALKRGRVRDTFRMSFDARARYEYPIEDLMLAGSLDIFNLFGSGTEIAENPLTGPDYRKPLEMVPGRAIFLSGEILWK